MEPDKKHTADELSFEQLLVELESIVSQLEKGQLSLEDAVKAYERGMLLSQEANGKLKHAEKRIEILMKDGNQAPFEGTEP